MITMRNLSWRKVSSAVRVGVPLAAVLVLAVACASSGGSSNSAGSGGSGSSTVMSHSGPSGTYLTDGNGKTLYLFAGDTGTSSTCTAGCAQLWPPFTVSGQATAGSGATASDLGTTKRSDGKTQVTYNGHPLYYYAGDSSAGQTNGEGSNQFGAEWWMVDASGNAIQSGAGASSAGSDAGGAWS
ncbi:MAG TPA: hypothetical protein VFR11_20595 [Micromonosporaceae bacterium]|jgi:predicted lipoprotein with Yx(FWY)xxD motif|nr:hypothetical protein [Micromonosporaceae bacterium]